MVTSSWSKKYLVRRSTSIDGKYEEIKRVTSTSYIDSRLTTNKIYYYKVCAITTIDNKNNYGEYSKVVYAKPYLSSPILTLTSGTKKLM